MAGLTPVGTWRLSNYTTDNNTTYFGSSVDPDFAVAQRVADAFAPKPNSPAGMSVVLDPGFVVAIGPAGLQTITEIGAQTVTIAAAPSSPNNRIDLVVVDSGTGVAAVTAGTPATSPVAPALGAGKKQVAQVSVPNGTSSIGASNVTDLRAVWGHSVPGVAWAVAGGSADAITAAYTPANPALVDGLILGFRASAANVTTTPSFAPDGLTAHTITKKGGSAVLAGDIPAALAECLVRYNAANTRWELLNPAVSLPTIANNHLLANISGSSAAPVDTAVSTLIDDALGNTNNDVLQRVSGSWVATTLSGAVDNAIGATRGAILERGASGWALIAPGTSGQVLTSNGSGADPTYQSTSAPTGYGALDTYTTAAGTYSPGTNYTLGGLGGTWQCMGVFNGVHTVCCGLVVLAYGLFQRIA